MSVSKETVLETLSRLEIPNGEGNIVSVGMVSDPFITVSEAGAKVMFSLSVPAEMAEALEPLRLTAQKAVENIPGVASAMAVMTAERKPGAGGGSGPAAVSPGAGPPSAGSMNPKATVAPPAAAPSSAAPASPQAGARGVPGVRHIIAVASGKGGVGKSTTAVNLALALKETGLSVGILDADIYGPSLPKLLGLNQKPEADGRVLQPLVAYGLKAMSIGFLIAEDSPMIWRGPMVISALTQLLREVAWGTEDNPLDVLVVDMPPGTGDAQLTMAQQVPLTGAVIVSTPQDLSLIDARKGLNMFKKVSVPILGIVENMSYFICPSCGEQSNIFGHGGAREEAERLDVPFLGGVPLHMDIRSLSDAGTPVVVERASGPHAAVYRGIASAIAPAFADEVGSGPKIVFE
ncbi:MAG: Mrp/NBP35 family ATP-binding protein [Pseudomonadota bacterium]